MGDSVLTQIGGTLMGIYALLSGAIKTRDQLERRKQLRNGGTPMDHVIREQRAVRREMRAARKTLTVIARSSEEQCRLLKDGESAHRNIAATLAHATNGLTVLLDRGMREQK